LLIGILASWIYFSSRSADTRLFGVGEPLSYRISWNKENFRIEDAFARIQFLKASYLREWVWRWILFNENGTINRSSSMVSALNDISREARELDIKIIGMAQDFPGWMTNLSDPTPDNKTIPNRNMTEGSAYRIFLEKYEESWRLLAETFPNITLWEIGNEYNLHEFLHPPGYKPEDNSTWFSLEENVDIVTDLLYYGSIGIHEGNPGAETIMCGLGPPEFDLSGIRDFLNATYQNIKSGRWPSQNTHDFFEIACWHPYLNNVGPNQSNWIDPNNAIRNVMENNGDSDKSVIFSEFGYSDRNTGLSQTQIADFLNHSYETAAENFKPWLKTMCWFRLIDPDQGYDRGLNSVEYGFGLFMKSDGILISKPAGETYHKIDR